MDGYKCNVSSDQKHRDEHIERIAKVKVDVPYDYNNPMAQGRLNHVWT